jgi:chemotaxis signal transduction protein
MNGRSESRPRSVDWTALKERTRLGLVHEPADAELDAVFSERALALSRNVDSGDVARSGSVLFAFVHDAMTFAVELESVLRVLGKRRLSRIPGAPRHLDRVFYESGRIVSSVSPSVLFGSADEDGGSPLAERIVLLDSSGTWLGVRATTVLGPRRFGDAELGKPSSALAPIIAPCVRGIAQDLTIMLDGTALVERLRQKVKE